MTEPKTKTVLVAEATIQPVLYSYPDFSTGMQCFKVRIIRQGNQVIAELLRKDHLGGDSWQQIDAGDDEDNPNTEYVAALQAALHGMVGPC